MRFAVLLALAAMACRSADPRCDGLPGRVVVDDYRPAADDVVTLASLEGEGTAVVVRYGKGGEERLLLPLVFASDGAPVPEEPGQDLAFCLPRTRRNVTFHWLGHPRPSEPDGLGPLRLGDHELDLVGTDGPDRVGADVTGALLVDAGDGDDILVLGGDPVIVDAGPGHDAVTVRDRGTGHHVAGGPGRDRLVVGGTDVVLLGGDDDDCVFPVGSSWLLADGGPGTDRSPLDLDVEHGALAGTAEGTTWCGPLASPTPDADADAWPDADARAVEALLLDAILERRMRDPRCDGHTWTPSPARTTGLAARRLQGVARAHAAAVDGYPGPQSDGWDAGAFVARYVVPDGSMAHQDPDGNWYDQRAMKGGDPIGESAGGVGEAIHRCVADEPACSGPPEDVAEHAFSAFVDSPTHCDLLMGRDEPATGVVIAVGVHRQDRSWRGQVLDPPGWFVDVLVEDDLGPDADRP